MDKIKINQYDKYVLELLQKNTFQASKELCDSLCAKFSITNQYARKILERCVTKGIIKSSSPLTFSKGQFVYFSESEKLTKDAIKKIAKKYRPPLYRLLEILDINNGIISYYEALKITASIIEKGNSKNDFLDDLIELLRNRNFIYTKTDINNVKYIISSHVKEKEDQLIKDQYSSMIIDSLFVKDIIEWLSKSNLILNLNNRYRNKTNPSLGATHNNLVWDAFGYTKATGLNPFSSSIDTVVEKQTLVVVDVLMSRDYSQIDIDGFLSRVQININSVTSGVRKIIPIVVYKSCPFYILKKLKALGFLCYDIGSIYGSNIFTILENVSKLQFNKKLLQNEEFEKTMEETLSAIKNSGQEDQLKSLKGTLFEVMMYQILKHQYPNADISTNVYYSKYIFNNEIKKNEKRGFEYDLVIRSSNPKEIIVVELKGYHSQYQIPLGSYEIKNSVKWFFNRTLTFIKEKYNAEIENGYLFKAVYLTSCKFEDEALNYLEKLNEGSYKGRKLDVFYDRKKLINHLETNDFISLKNIIEKFYI